MWNRSNKNDKQQSVDPALDKIHNKEKKWY